MIDDDGGDNSRRIKKVGTIKEPLGMHNSFYKNFW